MDWLLQMIGKRKIDLIITGIEIDVHKWFEHIPEIETVGAKNLRRLAD